MSLRADRCEAGYYNDPLTEDIGRGTDETLFVNESGEARSFSALAVRGIVRKESDPCAADFLSRYPRGDGGER